MTKERKKERDEQKIKYSFNFLPWGQSAVMLLSDKGLSPYKYDLLGRYS